MPETKGKNTEQINEKFRVTRFSVLQNNLSPNCPDYEEATGINNA